MAQAYRSNTLAGALTRLQRRLRVLAFTARRDAVPRTPGDVAVFMACSAFWLLFCYAWAAMLGVVRV